jgi:hypothetical protein
VSLKNAVPCRVAKPHTVRTGARFPGRGQNQAGGGWRWRPKSEKGGHRQPTFLAAKFFRRKKLAAKFFQAETLAANFFLKKFGGQFFCFGQHFSCLHLIIAAEVCVQNSWQPNIFVRMFHLFC